MSRPWDSSTIESFFYAKGDVIGFATPERATPRNSPSSHYFGKIEGPPMLRDPNLRSFLKEGITWYHQTNDLGSDGLTWNDKNRRMPLFLHGIKPEMVELPTKLDWAVPIRSGVLWDRKFGYVLWNERLIGARDFFKVTFATKRIKISRVPSSGHDLPPASTYLPVILYDGSICIPLNGGYATNRPAQMKYMHGTGIYDPKVGKWKYYDGLVVWGTSHDNHLVAFSEYPWKTVQVARVDAPTIR